MVSAVMTAMIAIMPGSNPEQMVRVTRTLTTPSVLLKPTRSRSKKNVIVRASKVSVIRAMMFMARSYSRIEESGSVCVR